MDFSRMSDAELERIANSGAPAQSAPNPFDQFDPPAEKNPFDQFDPPAKPWEQFPDEKGDALADHGSTFGGIANAYGRIQGLGARIAIGEGTKGVLSLGTLPVDALVNAGYGLHKLAARTGLVGEPDARSYYGRSDSYLPTTSGVSAAVDEGLDKAATTIPKIGGYLRAPETPTERLLSAIGGGAVGAMTGAGAARLIPGRVGGFLAAQPGVQAAAGGVGGATGQGAREAGADDTTAALIGLGSGFLAGAAGARAARPGATPVPTTAELRAAKSAAYRRSEAAGVQFTPDAVDGLNRQVRTALPGQGIFLDMDPKARGVMEPLARSASPDASGRRQAVSLERLDNIRQQAGNMARSLDQNERRTGAVLAEHIDDFLDNAHPGQVAVEGVGALREARAANRRYAKASALDVALDKAELRASSTGAGMNGQNTVKQNLRTIIENPNSRAFRQFDPPEREAMRRIVQGDRVSNGLRLLGKAAPTGAVSGLFGLGLTASNPMLAAVPAAGIVAKATGEAMQRGRVRDLENLVRGGPGAGRRPSARYGANAARGAAQGFLAAPSSYQDDDARRSRYR